MNVPHAPRAMEAPRDRTGFRHLDRLRVRWAEVDQQRIVFNGHYLLYFDTAMGAYWRAMAVPYAATMAQLGGDLYVRRATVDYEGSARYDDLLEVGLRCARVGTSSLHFDGAVFLGARRLVTCELVYVFADPASQTSRPVPASLREALADFEAGQAMATVHLGDWSTLGTEAQALRHAVFVQAQGIAASLDQDPDDHAAVHAVARNRFGHALATGRLLPALPGVASISRLAVDARVRGAGLGAAVLEALCAAAAARGDATVALDAPLAVEGFYRRAGFRRQGAPFVAAGLDHVRLLREA